MSEEKGRPAYTIEGVFSMSQAQPDSAAIQEFLSMEALPMGQLFDDLYFAGTLFVGALLLKTSAGLIMIDSMSRREDFEQIIEPKMREFGLNPHDIKILIITHGHFDHYGSAKHIKETYGCQVCMSEIDHKFMREDRFAIDVPTIVQGPEADPGVDRYLSEGDRVILGDTTVEVFFTPGHTPGGLSLIFPVHDGGALHTVGLWGGTQIPDDRVAAESYLASIQHFIHCCQEREVDTSVQIHTWADYTVQKGYFHGKVQAIKAAGGKNPFVMGPARFQILLETIRSAVTGKLEMMG